MGQHKIPKTEEKKEIYFIFFSKWQKNYQMENGFSATFAKLEDGRIVEYTEMCSNEKPTGNNIHEYVLLGKGDFNHMIGTPKYTPEITRDIRSEGLRNTTFTEKFILLKTHASLPCDDKVKIKSPKNILKKKTLWLFLRMWRKG